MRISRRRRKWQRFGWWAAVAAAVVGCISIVLTLPWRWLAPPTTMFVLQDRLHPQHLIQEPWVALEQMSVRLPIAVVAAEDQKFPHHFGFDFQSLSKALKEDRRHRRGASTITQQLAKNLFLWPGRSIVRKALEAYFTVLIELTWPKRRILEVYLNVVEYGPGIYGVNAASRSFFSISPRRLSSRQAALLAAVLPNPKRMSAKWPSPYVRQRAAEIEAAVRALGGPRYLAQL